MRHLLDQGIDAVRSLSDERQDVAGELLLRLAAPDADRRYALTPIQIADIQEAVHQADQGQFAGDDEMAALWQYCGL